MTVRGSVDGYKYVAGALLRLLSALKEGAKFSDGSVVSNIVTEEQIFYTKHRGIMPLLNITL